MSKLQGLVSYALDAAHDQLTEALSNERDVRGCIERFVSAVYQIPGGREELQRRATLIEVRCGPGSEYVLARNRSLELYRQFSESEERTVDQSSMSRRGKEALCKLSVWKPPQSQLEVDLAQDKLRDVLDAANDGTLCLDNLTHHSFQEWYAIGWRVKCEAEQSQPYGCGYLLDLHRAGSSRCEEAISAEVFGLPEYHGSTNLPAIKRAADSLMDWAVAAPPAQADAGSNPPEYSRDASSDDSPSGFLGGSELAIALGIHSTRKAAFFRQLTRIRLTLGDDSWNELSNRRPNSPQFIYRVNSTKVREIAAAYQEPKSS